MNPIHLLWLLTAGIAVVSLVKIMRGRQVELTQLLKDYVTEQVEWAKKRAKSMRLAQEAAEKARREEEAAMRAAAWDAEPSAVPQESVAHQAVSPETPANPPQTETPQPTEPQASPS